MKHCIIRYTHKSVHILIAPTFFGKRAKSQVTVNYGLFLLCYNLNWSSDTGKNNHPIYAYRKYATFILLETIFRKFKEDMSTHKYTVDNYDSNIDYMCHNKRYE